MSLRDIVVRILARLGLYKPTVNLINHYKEARQARLMKKNGLEMLREADKALSKANVRGFLSFGTLLGAYRDHNFISYDPDIDLGILAEEATEEMHESLKQAGFRLLRQNYMSSNGQVVEETYEYRGLHLDIFFYYRKGNDFYTVIQRHHESKEWKEANITDGFPADCSYVPLCGFSRHDFLGLNIYMPDDTDGWLRAIYSDTYMTPIKNWNAEEHKTRTVRMKERSYRRYF